MGLNDYMIKVIYSKDGEPISDFKVYDSVDRMIETYKSCPNIIIKVSSELYLLVFGLRALEEKISVDEVEFYFEDNKLDFHPCLGILDPDDQRIGFYSEVIDKAVKVGYEKMRKNVHSIT